MDWSSGQVQKWLLWTEHLYRLPQVGKAFQHLSGSDLCVMSEDDFRQRCLPCADVLFAHLDIWKTGNTFPFMWIYSDWCSGLWSDWSQGVNSCFMWSVTFTTNCKLYNDSVLSIWFLKYWNLNPSSESLLFISASWMKDRCSPQSSGFIGKFTVYWFLISDTCDRIAHYIIYNNNNNDNDSCVLLTKQCYIYGSQQFCGCGSAGADDLCVEADSSCSGQPIHLWQFLRELLLKPYNYGRSIRWINKEKGEDFVTTSPLHLLHLQLLLHTQHPGSMSHWVNESMSHWVDGSLNRCLT